jgi:N-acetylmuramoyl-L-alanine amidase
VCDRREVTHTGAAALLCALIALHGEAGAAPSPVALQEKRLQSGKSALERLRADAKRRRYRDAWEAVVRELDGAVRAAPGGPRAAEAALWAARAREELWKVSRNKVDAAAAVAAYRKVDEAYAGAAPARRALLLGAQLSHRTGDKRSAASAAKRLAARYGGSREAAAAADFAHDEPVQPATTPAEPEDEEQVDPPAPPETAPTRSPPPQAEEAAEHAAMLLDRVIEAAKAQAAVASENASGEDRAGELPPEPEAAEPLQGLTAKAAIPPRPEDKRDHGRAAKARELRAAARKGAGSVAAQLGLKVRRVLIDPGHGGRDTGAIGSHGLREKDVALAISKVLAARLRALGFVVVLTRKNDSYVSLDERTRIANEARADLFVSVHCNAARHRKLAGVETWTLNVASDRYAARLASFENADAERTVSDLRLILADLATRANATDARDLAQAVQSSLVRNLRARVGRVEDHGTKQALFYVLLGARMPAILVETGFISNPAEEARLRSRRYQTGAAEAIARGVKDFVDSRQRLARAQ